MMLVRNLSSIAIIHGVGLTPAGCYARAPL